MSNQNGDGGEKWYDERIGFPEKTDTGIRERHKLARGKLYEVLHHYGYTQPKGVGKQWVQCPFHGDAHASAGVDWGTNFFTCFACEMKGTAIDLVMKKEGVDLDGATRFIELL